MIISVSTSTTASTASALTTTGVLTATNTETTSTTTTTTTIACAYTNTSILASFGSSPPSSWTEFSYSFTAISTTTTLRFTSATGAPAKMWYLDNVVVASVTNLTTNLLLNGNFDTGTSFGWQLYSCSSACSATIISSSSCYGSSGSCYSNSCTPTSNLQFLEQSFTTTVGAAYNISFWLIRGSSGVGSGIDFYVNVL